MVGVDDLRSGYVDVESKPYGRTEVTRYKVGEVSMVETGTARRESMSDARLAKRIETLDKQYDRLSDHYDYNGGRTTASTAEMNRRYRMARIQTELSQLQQEQDRRETRAAEPAAPSEPTLEDLQAEADRLAAERRGTGRGPSDREVEVVNAIRNWTPERVTSPMDEYLGNPADRPVSRSERRRPETAKVRSLYEVANDLDGASDRELAEWSKYAGGGGVRGERSDRIAREAERRKTETVPAERDFESEYEAKIEAARQRHAAHQAEQDAKVRASEGDWVSVSSGDWRKVQGDSSLVVHPRGLKDYDWTVTNADGEVTTGTASNLQTARTQADRALAAQTVTDPETGETTRSAGPQWGTSKTHDLKAGDRVVYYGRSRDHMGTGQTATITKPASRGSTAVFRFDDTGRETPLGGVATRFWVEKIEDSNPQVQGQKRYAVSSQAGRDEASFALETAEADGYDPGFRIVGTQVEVYDPQAAGFALEGVRDVLNDNLDTRGGYGFGAYGDATETRRARQKRDSLTRLIDKIKADNPDLVTNYDGSLASPRSDAEVDRMRAEVQQPWTSPEDRMVFERNERLLQGVDLHGYTALSPGTSRWRLGDAEYPEVVYDKNTGKWSVDTEDGTVLRTPHPRDAFNEAERQRSLNEPVDLADLEERVKWDRDPEAERLLEAAGHDGVPEHRRAPQSGRSEDSITADEVGDWYAEADRHVQEGGPKEDLWRERRDRIGDVVESYGGDVGNYRVKPEIQVAPGSDAPEREPSGLTYRERRAARAERLRGWAANRETKANAVFEANRSQTSDWAFITQPGRIPARERIIRQEDRAYESLQKAKSMASRADSIDDQAAGAIYSDDPDAVEQLEARIETLEAERERIKAFNATARKGAADLSLLNERERRNYEKVVQHSPYSLGKGGQYPSYHLSNLSGNIKRQRDRLAQLRREQAKRVQDLTEGDGLTSAGLPDLADLERRLLRREVLG